MMEKYGQQEDVGKVFNGDPWTVRQDQAKASANSATQAEANYLRDFIEGIKDPAVFFNGHSKMKTTDRSLTNPKQEIQEAGKKRQRTCPTKNSIE